MPIYLGSYGVSRDPFAYGGFFTYEDFVAYYESFFAGDGGVYLIVRARLDLMMVQVICLNIFRTTSKTFSSLNRMQNSQNSPPRYVKSYMKIRH